MKTPPDPAEIQIAAEPRRVLADRVRDLASMTILSTVDDGRLAQASAVIEDAIALVAGSARTGRYDGLAGLAPGAASNDQIWETHAVFGRSNPLAPPILVNEQQGRVSGIVTFHGGWEGGPGTVYGGFIAAAFDGMLGRAVISGGHLAVTKSLEVSYLRPTPLHKALRIESFAGARSGQNVPATAQLWDGDILTCEAKATFTCVDKGRYQS